MSSFTNTFEYLSRWMYNLAYNAGLSIGYNNGYGDGYSHAHAHAQSQSACMQIYVWDYADPDEIDDYDDYDGRNGCQQACVVARDADEARFLIRHAINTSSETNDRFVRFQGQYSYHKFIDGDWLNLNPTVHHITHPCFVSHLDKV